MEAKKSMCMYKIAQEVDKIITLIIIIPKKDK